MHAACHDGGEAWQGHVAAVTTGRRRAKNNSNITKVACLRSSGWTTHRKTPHLASRCLLEIGAWQRQVLQRQPPLLPWLQPAPPRCPNNCGRRLDCLKQCLPVVELISMMKSPPGGRSSLSLLILMQGTTFTAHIPCLARTSSAAQAQIAEAALVMAHPNSRHA